MNRQHFLPSLFTESEPADIVMETTRGTYIGKFDRAKIDRSLPAEQQPIWSIRLVETLNDTTIRTLYPSGMKQAMFVWDDKDSYNYQYAL